VGAQVGEFDAGVCFVAAVDSDDHRSQLLTYPAEIQRASVDGTKAVDRGDQRHGLRHRRLIITEYQDIFVERVVEMTLAEPPGEATHWTGREMAKAAGISLRSVQRIWAAHGLQPHRVRSFKLSNDAKFAAKVQDIVGLYVNPPEHALVLSVDEKSQIQALDRTQPGLPMPPSTSSTARSSTNA